MNSRNAWDDALVLWVFWLPCFVGFVAEGHVALFVGGEVLRVAGACRYLQFVLGRST